MGSSGRSGRGPRRRPSARARPSWPTTPFCFAGLRSGMATNADLARGLKAVQAVLASDAFMALAADGDALKECFDDPEGTLRRRGVVVPEEVCRVEMKVRHTPPAARQAGLRGGNFEWRVQVRVGAGSWRVLYLCDAWPLDAAAAGADGADDAEAG